MCVSGTAELGGWRGASHPQEGSHRQDCMGPATDDSRGRPKQVVSHRRGEVWMAQNGVGKTWWGHSGCSQSGAYTGLWRRKEMSAERWWARSALLPSSASASGWLLSQVSMVLSVQCALTIRKCRKCPRLLTSRRPSRPSRTPGWTSLWDQRHRARRRRKSSWMRSMELFDWSRRWIHQIR